MSNAPSQQHETVNVRGRLSENAPLGQVGWFRTGGSADLLFKPADSEDLQQFLSETDLSTPVQVFGVMSNSIIRDGGVRGATIRLGREFSKVEMTGDHQVTAGAMCLDARVAGFAAENDIAGLEFFSGIPGTVGGAIRMNAGCYGQETKNVLLHAKVMDRQGNIKLFSADEMNMAYRYSALPADSIVLEATFQGQPGSREKILSHMQEIRHRREQSQPIRERTGGSTFANPDPADLEKLNLPAETKVWQLIDRSGCRGLTIGGAMMSEKHCNFMINTGEATAADLENLGEEVRRRVAEKTGITLRWEIKRIGEH
jgi:UDP-N-acetylmuramate dehydrogenase